MDDVKDVLGQYDEEAEDIPAQEGAAGLPEGNYQARIDVSSSGNLVAQDSDGAHRARVILEAVTAADPTLIGKRDSKSWMLVDGDGNLSEMGVSIFKGDLQVLGIDFTKLSDADKMLAQAIGAVVGIAVRNTTKKNDAGQEVTYHNIYFNDLVQPANAGEGDDEY